MAAFFHRLYCRWLRLHPQVWITFVFRQLQGPVMASYIMDRLGDLLRILWDQGGEACFPHLIWHTQYQWNWF